MKETFQLAPSINRFTETFRQSFLALSFDLGGLLAGSILVKFSGVLSLASWVLIIYPSILSMRGVIGGFFSGRLSTGLHLGTIKSSFTKNTRSFYNLYYATLVLTFQSSLMMGVLASFLSVFFWKTPLIDTVSILSVIITTMGLSLLFVSPATLAVSVLAFRYGLDPDIIVYPIMSTFADILVTVCFILALKFSFYFGYLGSYVSGLFDIAFLFVALYLLVRYRKKEDFAKTMKEFSFTLVIVTLIVNVTGNVLGKISQVIGSRPEIYMVYPALIDTIGDVGSIIGSTSTTKLALGTVDPLFRSIKKNIPEISGALLSSSMWFVLFSLISFYFTYGATLLHELLKMVAMLLTLNIIAAPIISVIAYSVAVLTYKQGLDPDNFVIPVESSLSDSVTTICLLIVVNLFGGLGAAL